MSQYDEFATLVSRELGRAEFDRIDPEQAISRLLNRQISNRVGDFVGKETIHQVIGCDVSLAEEKGNAYVEWFMDPTRPDYKNYPVEVQKFLSTFSTQTELIAYIIQLLNHIRLRKQSEQKQRATWGDHFTGL